jgi:precorrin-2 dehydrogenase/sirohydrochlorin ferrochelatase
MSNYYPIYVQLQGRPCVVVGGGLIAEGKVDGLLAANARVTLISPRLTGRLRAHVDLGEIIHISRSYLPGDLSGAFLVICATDQVDINHQVWLEATANKQLVNVVDDTPRCNFIAPSILRQGDLTIAISTGGKAPALAVRLKEHFQVEIGPQYAQFLKLAGKLRKPLAQHISDFETRKALWYQLVDSNVLELLAQNDEAAALQKVSEVVGFDFRPD